MLKALGIIFLTFLLLGILFCGGFGFCLGLMGVIIAIAGAIYGALLGLIAGVFGAIIGILGGLLGLALPVIVLVLIIAGVFHLLTSL